MDNTSVKVHKNARHIQFHSCQHVSLLSTVMICRKQGYCNILFGESSQIKYTYDAEYSKQNSKRQKS
ncbi:hypothetical protein T4E_10752 [Trichinella pseudospiralis]|uniref:Uncharacterized protein n=1 Tax=Trichinella pseudospiralis TaxID=6337 RepID=A0A0V0Y8T5_TRIPS|nr:hypothetical protein T4E_10752 [Trichinella pseudospiralis]